MPPPGTETGMRSWADDAPNSALLIPTPDSARPQPHCFGAEFLEASLHFVCPLWNMDPIVTPEAATHVPVETAGS